MEKRIVVLMFLIAIAFLLILIGIFDPFNLFEEEKEVLEISEEFLDEYGYVPGKIIVKFIGNISLEKKVIDKKSIVISNFPSINNIFNKYNIFDFESMQLENTFILESSLDVVDEIILELSKDSNVEYAEPDKLMEPTNTWVNDPKFPEQWNLFDMGIPEAWDITMGEGVTIAVLDSGLLDNGEIFDNEEFEGKILEGYNFWDMNKDTSDTSVGNYHGTRVAGLAVANANNSILISGVCPKCKILPVKVCGPINVDGEMKLKCSRKAATLAINWIKNNQIADIIVMSFGSYERWYDKYTHVEKTFKETIDDAYKKGIIMVAGAGNENTYEKLYPAGYDNVIAVAAVERDYKRWYDNTNQGSNYGSWIDISAFVNLMSGNSYFRGTSAAAPQVAGVLGLLKSAFPEKSSGEIINLLYKGAKNIDSFNPGYEGALGVGVVNAKNSFLEVEKCIGTQTTEIDCSQYQGGHACENEPFFCGNTNCQNYQYYGTFCTCAALDCEAFNKEQCGLTESEGVLGCSWLDLGIKENQPPKAVLNISLVSRSNFHTIIYEKDITKIITTGAINIYFNASGSFDEDDFVSKYIFNRTWWGEDETYYESSIPLNQEYLGTGEYKILLTVKDFFGAADTIEKRFIVSPCLEEICFLKGIGGKVYHGNGDEACNSINRTCRYIEKFDHYYNIDDWGWQQIERIRCNDTIATFSGEYRAVCVEPTAAFCGNNIVEIGEECDDGNDVDGDGCSGNCETEAPSEEGLCTGTVTYECLELSKESECNEAPPCAWDVEECIDAITACSTWDNNQTSCVVVAGCSWQVESEWTSWYDRDNPSGTGDYEDIATHKQLHSEICETPTQIECQTVAGVDYTETGQTVRCDITYGFYCKNNQNVQTGDVTCDDPDPSMCVKEGPSCLDYKVRFYCGGLTGQPYTGSIVGNLPEENLFARFMERIRNLFR